MVDVVAGGRVLTTDRQLAPYDIVIESGRVHRLVGRGTEWPECDLLDATGCIVAPGFIDTHVHGGGGYNFMGVDGGEGVIAAHLASSGVTACMATTATTSRSELLRSISNLAGCDDLDGDVEVLGIHLEGPFLAESHRGVHPAEHLRPPTGEELGELMEVAGDRLRIVTLAPELPGADDAVRGLVERGVIVSLGHSAIGHDGARAAFRSGVRRVTHCFNGLPPIHHRRPGPVVAAISDPSVSLELVADGRLVDPAAMRWLWQQVGTDGLVLISDGTDVAGLPDGMHRRWEGTEVVLEAGTARTTSGGLAGGTKGLASSVQDLVLGGVLPIADALVAASESAARSIGQSHRKGRLLPGLDADLVVLREDDLRLVATVRAGRLTYQASDHSVNASAAKQVRPWEKS